MMMSKKNVEELLIAGGADETLRSKYDALKTKEEFVALAKADGYEFTVQDLDAVLRESGDAFESFGNPPKRVIWWQ
jgi:predicted ribosomally synthesized peptide with nif11-like leader